MDTVRNKLPVQLTSFIGRDQEIGEVIRLLHATRLLTLTGSGGTGKTRLSLQVGGEVLAQFPDGVWFVELAALADPALVPQTVASALSVLEQPGRSIQVTLTDHLRDKNLLLVLDNCEHIIEACARFADTLLRAALHLTILASSREGLGIAGETTYHVPSLRSPNPRELIPLADLTKYEAVQLFVERARAANPAFAMNSANGAAVAQICHHLDGIPLAIELAAARVKMLSAEQIATRLNDRFRLLTGGSRTALPRQQTLRGAIDWSYDLLSEPERIFLRRLSVFAGGWSFDATESVGAGDGIAASEVLDLLTRLVEKSLVAEDEQTGEARYRMLETIRQYAQEKLSQSGEEQRVRARHLDFFMRLAERAEPQLHGPDQVLWFDRMETELDNVRAATDWSLSSSSYAAGLRLCVALYYFWFTRGYVSEGLDRLACFLMLPEASERTRVRARALEIAARYQPGDYAKARLQAEEALAIARQLGDREIAFDALRCLTQLATRHRDFVAAHSWLEQMLPIASESGNKFQVRYTLMTRGDLALQAGDYEQAQSFYEESAALIRKLNDNGQLSYELRNLGHIALHQAQYEKAIARYQESLAHNEEVHDTRGCIACVAGLAAVASAQAHIIHSARLLGAVEALLAAIPAELLYLDQGQYHQTVALVRGQMDDKSFSSAWAEGRALTLEQAIQEAKNVAVSELNLTTQPREIHPAGLTVREVEVLRLLAEGLTNAQIAERLVLSKRTVHAHLRSIFSKLDVTTRTAAARVAIEYKLV